MCHTPLTFPFSIQVRVVMSGHVGDLSPEQETALQLFKFAVKGIPNKPDDTDYFYLRWLRAGKFNLLRTERMFRNVCVNVAKLCSILLEDL